VDSWLARVWRVLYPIKHLQKKKKIERNEMPKKKRGKGRSSRSKGGRGKGKNREVARRERRLGQYLSPGDEDYKQLSQQLRKEGLALKDVPGDGCVCVMIP